ncbi:MAG: hypothetical protein CR997_02010 [Acidobacteria bacterium]|nr:MAG: hypothetical protein CR997_02010 [Acidobacteriota bacterium]
MRLPISPHRQVSKFIKHITFERGTAAPFKEQKHNIPLLKNHFNEFLSEALLFGLLHGNSPLTMPEEHDFL